MTSNQTKKQIDYWENKTSVFVHFGSWITMDGAFWAEELLEIARLQLKREKELHPVVKANQKGLFDD